jgi:DNA-directed RNA polymerase specialized sigma24 family protein
MNQRVSPELQNGVGSACDLFSEHGTAIYTMILLHVNDKTQADDLYQELFLSIVKKPLPENLDAPLAYL